MSTLWLDTETYSDVPLANGHHAYAQGSEVLLVPYTWDDQPKVHVADLTKIDFLPRLQGMINSADEVVLQNSAFDRTVLGHHGIRIPVEKITDTMVMALEHSLPGSLDKLCELLQVPFDLAKAKNGKKLIHLFCKPLGKNRKLRRATSETHPQEWLDFIEYARMDVVAMREVYKSLPRWNWTPVEIALWWLDQAINDRGFAVDLELATAALRAADRTSERLALVIDGLTSGEVTRATQRQKTLDYVNNVLGHRISDLKAATIEAELEDPLIDPRVRDVLECRAEGAATSPAKYRVLLRSTSPDGRLRGTGQFCGASRTGRDAGRIFQPYNLPRPTLKQPDIDLGIQAMKLDVEDLMYPNVMELCSSAIRGCIVAEHGKKLLVADLSNIEGRMVAWLAGEATKLKRFKDFDTFVLDAHGERIPDGQGDFVRVGPEVYKLTAGDILGKRPEDITKDERQKYGKPPELLLGFGGAVGALQRAKVDMSETEMVSIIKTWRRLHPNIVRLWYASEKAAITAVKNPGKVYEAGKLRFRYTPNDIMPMLLMKLPSGRFLCYPHAEVQGGKLECVTCLGTGILGNGTGCPACEGSGQIDYGDETLMYQGNNPYTHQWGVVDTYGGKIIENATQAAARDIFYHGARKAQAAGYDIVGRVYDELICEVPDTPDFTFEKLSEFMAAGPLWSLGLPLAADGFETYRYRKD